MIFQKISISLLFFLIGWLVHTPLNAQFLNSSMEVESELSVQVIQDLNFGTFITNSGVQRINLQSPDIGVFKIRAFGNQNVLVTLNMPDSLSSSSPEIQEQIPLTLKASYSNNENQSAASSIPITGSTASFPIGNTNLATTDRQWQSAYIYVFGEVLIGEVPKGEYSASLVLSVEYQ